MKISFVEQHYARIIFIAAVFTILFALAEGFIQIFGQSLIGRIYSPGRLLDLAGTLLVFVIIEHLRQIRNELRAK